MGTVEVVGTIDGTHDERTNERRDKYQTMVVIKGERRGEIGSDKEGSARARDRDGWLDGWLVGWWVRYASIGVYAEESDEHR